MKIVIFKLTNFLWSNSPFKFFALIVITLFSFNLINAQSQIFTTSGSFTVPAGVTQITVEAWGGGGRGGTRTTKDEGGGGGGGAYARSVITVIPENTYTVTVGSGSTTTAAGGDSWFINNTTILAKGGNSVPDNNSNGAAGGSETSSIGGVKYAGGNGSNVVSSNGGGGGSSAGTGANGTNATNSTGATAPTGGGNGGNGATANNSNGSPGIAPGGGGGGSKNNGGTQIGGAGANGQIIISWTRPALTIGPGGVTSDLQLWLRADLLDGTATIANNTKVTNWKTQATGNSATANTGQEPTYRNNATHNLNFNPVVDFDNDYNFAAADPDYNYVSTSPPQQYLQGIRGFYNHDIFIVVIPDVLVNSSLPRMAIFNANSPLIGENSTDATGIGFGNNTIRFENEVLSYIHGASSSYGVAETSTSKTYDNVGIINARRNTSANGMEFFYNGATIRNAEANPSTYINIIDSKYWIGRMRSHRGSLDGKIAEIITYENRKDNTSERPKIETYLAIKYGITLSVNGISQHYVNSDNSVIYQGNAGYNFDIAGIGRDDVSKLNQKQSKSSNPSSIVTIGLGSIALTNTANTNTFATNKTYLVWGHNNASLVDAGTTFNKTIGASVTANYSMLNRKWKIVETGGDVAEVEITIPTSAISNFSKTATEEYVLVVSSTPAFADADIVDLVPLKTVGTNLQTWYDFDGTRYFTVAKTEKLTGNFQVNIASGDYLASENNINLNSAAFTISAWIQNNNATGIRTIIAKGNDYEVRLNAAKVEVLWNGTSRITSNASVSDNKWRHVAITFSGGSASLFIDGILDRTISSLPNPPGPTVAKLIIGAQYNNKVVNNPFMGNIDEIRIWDSALTVNQLRYIMNQEIVKFTDNTVNGTILPQTITRNEVRTIPWSNLKMYFNLNSIYGTAVEDQSNQRNFARINYQNTAKSIVNTQTAPLPYETSAAGNWETATTWKNGSNLILPNSNNINWNIINLKHQVSATTGHTVLGLLSDALTKLTVQNNDSLRVTHYLKLNGIIDLTGESQLVQDQGSIIDATSTGSIEIDQQGTSDNFKFNYWGSPVNTTATNNYTIAGILRDGTFPDNIKTIDFGSAYTYADTKVTPTLAGASIKLSTYWMFKFTNKPASDYDGWSAVGKDGELKTGEGFTLKGSNSTLADQNYTFVGRPNNGDINLTIDSEKQYLIGNPYPSALEADQFIKDNISTAAGGNRSANIIDGNLYFWDHFGGGTHDLKSYEGGYSIYNLSGGTKAVSTDTRIKVTSNESNKAAQKFIPVAQGFFVSSLDGGTIQFKNSQRKFKKENSNVSVFLRNTGKSVTNKTGNTEGDLTPRIYLNYSSPTGFNRQLLVAFIPNTTDGIDIGYDAVNDEDHDEDMSWKTPTAKMIIQAVPTFDSNRVFPLEVKVATSGFAKISIDMLENISIETDIFIKDNLDGNLYNLKTNPFTVNVDPGTYSNRFELVLRTQKTLAITDEYLNDNLVNIYLNNPDTTIYINKNQSVEIKEINIYNMFGQQLQSIKKASNNQQIRIPFNVQTGVYIVNVITDGKTFSKKIIKY